MLNKVFCYILLVCFLGSQSSRVLIYLDFKLNQDFIAKSLCESKDKPQSNCGGTCYLAKKIKAQEEKERKESPNETRVKADVLFCADTLFTNEKHIFKNNIRNNKFPTTRNLICLNFISEIFHPPQLG